MPSPSTSLTTLRPDLAESFEEFDLESQRAGYIATRVLPIINVATAANVFGKIPVEQLLKARDTKRGPGSNYNRGDWKFEEASYATKENGWEEPVDDREARIYANYFDAEVIAAKMAFEAVLQSMEQRVSDLVFNSSTFNTTTVTNEWDDATNATPIADIKAAKTRAFAACGLWPNALVINYQVFENLRLCDEVTAAVAALGAGSPNNQASINEQVLSQVFDLPNIIVAGAAENTAKEGQAGSFGRVWSDEYAMICRVATTPNIKEPCIGRTFHYTEDGSMPGGTVETYREENSRSEIVRVRNDTDEQVIHAVAGELLDNITT